MCNGLLADYLAQPSVGVGNDMWAFFPLGQRWGISRSTGPLYEWAYRKLAGPGDRGSAGMPPLKVKPYCGQARGKGDRPGGPSHSAGCAESQLADRSGPGRARKAVGNVGRADVARVLLVPIDWRVRGIKVDERGPRQVRSRTWVTLYSEDMGDS
jgi:hypothetical protein